MIKFIVLIILILTLIGCTEPPQVTAAVNYCHERGMTLTEIFNVPGSHEVVGVCNKEENFQIVY